MFLSFSFLEICCALQVNDCSLFVHHFTDKQLFGEHISLAASPADDAGLDLKPCPPHQSGPEGAHGDTAILSAVATVCKRTSHEVSQYTGPSPKKLKSSATTEGGEAEKDRVGLEGEVVGMGEEAKIDPVGVPTWSGCSEPAVAVHEGDSPFPAALPNKAAQLSTSDNECGVPDDETSDETDSDADESFTCVPPAQDSEATFHVVPEHTLANSQEVNSSPLYFACPAPKDIAVLDRPGASTLALETDQMFSFEDKGNTLYAHVFSASSTPGKCVCISIQTYVCICVCMCNAMYKYRYSNMFYCILQQTSTQEGLPSTSVGQDCVWGCHGMLELHHFTGTTRDSSSSLPRSLCTYVYVWSSAMLYTVCSPQPLHSVVSIYHNNTVSFSVYNSHNVIYYIGMSPFSHFVVT